MCLDFITWIVIKIKKAFSYIFNLIAYQFVETKALSETNRMIGAIVSALICSELGARVGKWLDAREQAKGLSKELE